MQLNTPDMTAIVSKAILDSMDQVQRDTLVQEAIRSLLEPTKDQYGRAQGKSRLQDIFADQAAIAATQIIREKFRDDPEVKAQLMAQIDVVVSEMLKKDSSLVSVVESAIKKAYQGY